MISVEEALELVLSQVAVCETEYVPLADGDGRVLAADIAATRDQPPFAASAMDGYAVSTETPKIADRFDVIGEAAAGHASDQELAAGQAIRIFTGAPIPKGGVKVIIQEDVIRDGTTITVTDDPGDKTHIRPAGIDFAIGDVISGKRRLRPVRFGAIGSYERP